jgi:hypothetical protein
MVKSLVEPGSLRNIAIVTIGLLVVVLALQVWSGQQARHMARAADHIKLLQPRLAQDSRFRDIQLMPYTAEGGSLMIQGEVASDADRSDLERVVRDSHPPVKVVFGVWKRGEMQAMTPHQ